MAILNFFGYTLFWLYFATFKHILKTLQHIRKTLQHISLYNTFFNQNAKKKLYNTFLKIL